MFYKHYSNKPQIIFVIILVGLLTGIISAQHTNAKGVLQNIRNSAVQKPIASGSKSSLSEHGLQRRGMAFVENRGQFRDENSDNAPYLLYKSSQSGIDVYITEWGLSYLLIKQPEKKDEEVERDSPEKFREDEDALAKYSRVDMLLEGATIDNENIIKSDKLEGHYNFFYNYCPEGIYYVRAYRKITVKNVYPHIDWVIYSYDDKLKYDFIVNPGGDPSGIKLKYKYCDVAVDRNGSLVLSTPLGHIREEAPQCYQKDGSEIPSSFLKVDDHGIAFRCGSYDHTIPLVIDPKLKWSTFFGGTGLDGPCDAATDQSGNLFISGYVTSSGASFPVKNAGTYFDGTMGGQTDYFISKFSNSGVMLWSTFYGGNGEEKDAAVYLTVDVFGNVFVVGNTLAADFPVQNAGTYFDNTLGGTEDLGIIKFNNNGVRLWATYYGGDMIRSNFDFVPTEIATSICSDNSGNVFIVGSTKSPTFPLQDAGTFFDNSVSSTDIFLLKFDNSGNRLWATLYGGSGSDNPQKVLNDAAGNVIVTGGTQSTDFPLQNSGGYFDNTISGSDGILLKFDNNGNRLWATLIGGNNSDFTVSIAIDSCVAQGFYVEGQTYSTDFQTLDPGNGAYFDNTLAGTYDMFIAHFNNTDNMTWSTYFGGAGPGDSQHGNSLLSTCNGSLYYTYSAFTGDLPITGAICGNYVNSTWNNSFDLYIAEFNGAHILKWSTYFGATPVDFPRAITTDQNCNVFITGEFFSGGGEPTLNPGGGAYYDNSQNGGHDGFIIKLESPVTFIPSQVNAACSCNGEVSINIDCDQGKPYSYLWNTGNTTNHISDLCPGNYSVTISEICRKIDSLYFTILNDPCTNITASVNSATMCNGTTPCPTITATGSNGTLPYTYLWNTSATTANISPCPPNTTTYTVTITDAGGLTATSTSVVSVNPAVTANATSTNISCNGGTGSATATGDGGTSPYTYSWNNGQTTQTSTGLAQGTYTVKVTDSKGCTSTSTTTLISPPSLAGQFRKGSSNCIGCDCKEWIMVTAAGGTSPYSYSWPDGYNKRYKNHLCTGAYTINIKDKNGCSVNVNLTAP
ncbi:MAG: SBBP repeat-containing protein [Bacteroidetes bacterium]|nr:SBBP repeat-containing protein [Bacteroidota bacterium]